MVSISVTVFHEDMYQSVKNDVKEANFIELYWRYLSDILGGNINV